MPTKPLHHTNTYSIYATYFATNYLKNILELNVYRDVFGLSPLLKTCLNYQECH